MSSKKPDLEWDIDLDLHMRNGDPLKLVYGTNVETVNRGIVVDMVTAYRDDEKVGYLKIELFPTASVATFFPSGTLNYLAHFKGVDVFAYGEEATDIESADTATLQRIVDQFGSGWNARTTHVKLSDRSEFSAWFAGLQKTRYWKEKSADYQEFLDRRVEQAFVAYSNTSDPNQTNRLDVDGARRGIGTALYIAAAMELEKQGKQLRASGTRNDKATALWNSLSKKGIVEVVGDDQYLSAPMIRRRLGIEYREHVGLTLG